MGSYRIATFEGRPDILCVNEAELLQSLMKLSGDAFAYPTLVNVHSGCDRGVIIGLGTADSTLQLIDKGQGVTHRAVSETEEGEYFEFAYQGEATFVRRRFLVPQDLAIRAAVKWLSTDELTSDLKWTSGPCPPRI